MTQPDTHARLRAEIERRLAVARAWREDRREWGYVGQRRIKFDNGSHEDVASINVQQSEPTYWEQIWVRRATPDQAAHIALHDPADAIRRYEGELEVLERHAPVEYRGFDNGLRCAWCAAPSDAFSNIEWPCDEIRSLAGRLGVSVDG